MRQPLVLCLFALVACNQEAQTCTTQAVASVEVTVVDEQGAGIDDAVVTWGKNLEETACESVGDVIVCGWEVDGTLRITADAVGYAPVIEEVTVESDVCHVRTERLTLVLPAVDCPDVELPSVRVTLTDIASESMDSAWASIKLPGDDGPALPCEGTMDAKVFECWGLEPGKVDVLAGAPGYNDERVQIEIVEDDCGVVTYEQRFKLNRE